MWESTKLLLFFQRPLFPSKATVVITRPVRQNLATPRLVVTHCHHFHWFNYIFCEVIKSQISITDKTPTRPPLRVTNTKLPTCTFGRGPTQLNVCTQKYEWFHQHCTFALLHFYSWQYKTHKGVNVYMYKHIRNKKLKNYDSSPKQTFKCASGNGNSVTTRSYNQNNNV